MRRRNHPDKTFVGRIEKGFDFLGYHFRPEGLGVAEKTIADFVDKASRLYEQERGGNDCSSRFESYVTRWLGWVKGGLTRERSGPKIDGNRLPIVTTDPSLRARPAPG